MWSALITSLFAVFSTKKLVVVHQFQALFTGGDKLFDNKIMTPTFCQYIYAREKWLGILNYELKFIIFPHIN